MNGSWKVYGGLAAAVLTAAVLGVWSQGFQRLWDPRFTEERRDSINAHIITTQATLAALAEAVRDGAEQRKELRVQLNDMERKLDRLLWQQGIDPRTVKERK